MKIGFVFDDGLDAPDGVQQYMLTLAKWFAEQGHQVHFLVGQTTRTDIPNVHSLANNVSVSFNGNALSVPLPASKRAIKQLLQEERFDVLHVQMPYSPQLAGRVVALADAKTAVVGTFHILPYGRLQSLATKVLGMVLRNTLRRFDTVFAVSDVAGDFAQSSMGIRSSVVPNAVDIASFVAGKKLPQFDDDTLTIVFLGRLVERKGCMQLLRALARLHSQKKLSNLRVIIAGKGPQQRTITDYIAQHALGDIVTLVGWISETEKPNYLKSADIAVMPSIAGESFGIVLVEAIASGAGVVLGGDNPGYRYVLGSDENTLVDPRNTEQFALLLEKLISDRTLRERIGKQQAKRIQAFDVPVVGDQILRVYQAEIAKRHAVGNNKQYE